MKRRNFLIVVLALSVALCGALPAFAGVKADLSVNGDQVNNFNVLLEEGYSMVSVDAFARFAGVDVNLTANNTLQITEQDKTLELTVGKQDALLDNEPVTLPYAPVKSEGKVFVPLRYTAETFGFDVDWDNAQSMVVLNRSETRDGMTPSELLVKSNKVTQEVNTYSMDGTMDMQMKIKADGKEIKEVPQNIKMEMSGQIKSEPMEFYFNQKITPIGQGEVPEMTTETYMTTEKMYIKAPGQDEWIVQDMPFPAEFWREQQDIQSDPIKAAAQMKEMGMLLNFGSDTQIDGEDYYVVNATLDMSKFQEGYQKMMQQVVQGMNLEDDPQEMNQQMQKLIENMNIDYYYQAYINKDTLFNDIVKYDAKMDLNINSAELRMEEKSDAPKEMNMHYDMQGEFKIFGLGETFTAPDVSKAKDLKTVEEPVSQ
ncbi:MAG: copper amine oxidase N-terminal domain-containing protein [Firmicutes bacterium]|nr:copper amine oxidase N-terminal domain-containing protein [Bacillota bacterium]